MFRSDSEELGEWHFGLLALKLLRIEALLVEKLLPERVLLLLERV